MASVPAFQAGYTGSIPVTRTELCYYALRNKKQSHSFYPMKEEDQLILSAKEGDERAFGTLYDEYVSRIYRFIFLKVRRKQDAEDLTHQVFLNAWQNMKRYESRGFPFGSWLYRIASNAVIDFYRTSRNHASLEAIPEETFAELAMHEELLNDAFDLHLVRTALQKLEGDQQTVLILRFIDDRTNKEIAELLGKSEGAIRVVQHRALKQLKQYVDELRPQDTIKEA